MLDFSKMFACVAVLAIALSAAAERGWVHEHILDELERQLDAQFVGSIDAQRLSGTLWRGFTAHDIEVRDERGELVAHVEAFQVDASVFALLDGNFRFDRARLVRPVVVVERGADGEKNVERVFSSRDDEDDDKPRPPGKVLFEMARAEVVDGQLVYLDNPRYRSTAALINADAPSTKESRTIVAKAIDAEGSFEVRSARQTRLRIDRLDAALADGDQAHQLTVERARIDSDRSASTVTAGRLGVDGWRLDNLALSCPRGADEGRVGPVRPTELEGRITAPDGGWLRAEGHIDRSDGSYQWGIEAKDFALANLPGEVGWPWLVLDGAGAVSGRGWTRDTLEASVRWTSSEVDASSERFGRLHLDELQLDAHLTGQRVDVTSLEVAANGLTASARGHLSEDGGFALQMDTRADGALASRLAAGLGADVEAIERVELAVDASGALDLAEREAPQLLERVEADTTWKARGAKLDEVRWKTAGGSLKVRYPAASGAARPNERGLRTFGYVASAAVHELRHGAYGADVLRATVRGTAAMGEDAGIEQMSYALEGEADGLAFDGHRAEKARLVLDGALSPKDDGDLPLESLDAKGTFDVIGYRHDKLRARRVATNINVRGPFPVGRGSVVAHMSGLRIDGRRFRHAQLDLRLFDDRKFRLESKARVEISLLPDRTMHLDAAGRIGRELGALRLDELNLGPVGLLWRLSEPGLVRFDDGAVILQSLSLKRRSRRVRLDGTFGKAHGASLSKTLERLKDAQIRNFFDVGRVF